MMSTPDYFSAYQQNSVQGASPVGLIVALYDTILRDFRRAMDAMNRGNVETRVRELNHALTVIAHLKSILNFEKGTDAARKFNNFYEVTRGMILSANVDAREETLQKLIEMYSSVRQAWQQSESQLPK